MLQCSFLLYFWLSTSVTSVTQDHLYSFNSTQDHKTVHQDQHNKFVNIVDLFHVCTYHRVWSKFVGEHHPLPVGAEFILLLGELSTVYSKTQSFNLARPECSRQMRNVQRIIQGEAKINCGHTSAPIYNQILTRVAKKLTGIIVPSCFSSLAT